MMPSQRDTPGERFTTGLKADALRRFLVAALVPAAEVVDGQPEGFRAVQPRDDVVDRVGGPEGAADPAGRAPGQPVQLDVRVARLGLLHQPPLVARAAVDGAGGVLDARLRAVGGVGVAADLHLEDLQVRPVTRLEEVVEYLLLLGGRVVGQQAGVTAPATDRPDPVEGPAPWVPLTV